jgi:hypothetical protein
VYDTTVPEGKDDTVPDSTADPVGELVTPLAAVADTDGPAVPDTVKDSTLPSVVVTVLPPDATYDDDTWYT